MRITKIFAPICCALLLSACSSSYLMTINGENVKKNEDNGHFSFSNDTLQVDYSFAGKDGKVYLKIANKLDQPLLWNLKSSALIVNGKAFSYAGDNISVSGKVDGTVSSVGDRSSNIYQEDWIRGYFNGTIDVPKDIVLIPPHAYVEGSYFDLRNDIKEITKSAKKEKVHMYDLDGESYAVKFVRFTPNESPYNLRSYLMFSVLSGEHPLASALDHRFYAQQLMQTGTVSLNSIPEVHEKRGDVMVFKEKKGQNALLLGGVVALTAAAASVDDKQTE